MNFQNLPIFYCYYLNQAMPFGVGSYIECQTQNLIIQQNIGSVPSEICQNRPIQPQDIVAESFQAEKVPENQCLERDYKNKSFVKENKNLKKKKKNDEDFGHRKQTPNRNLNSNTFKIYLQQVQKKESETFKNMQKIIEINSSDMAMPEFIQKLNEEFPLKATYFSFEKMKKICTAENSTFGKILRVSLRHFFLYEIYAVGVKSIRTTRKIRKMQIMQGKFFVRQLTQSRNHNEQDSQEN